MSSTTLTEEQIKLIPVQGKIIPRLAQLFSLDNAAGLFYFSFFNHPSFGFDLKPADMSRIERHMNADEFYRGYWQFFITFESGTIAKNRTIGIILTVLDEINWVSMKDKILDEDWEKYGATKYLNAADFSAAADNIVDHRSESFHQLTKPVPMHILKPPSDDINLGNTRVKDNQEDVDHAIPRIAEQNNATETEDLITKSDAEKKHLVHFEIPISLPPPPPRSKSFHRIGRFFHHHKTGVVITLAVIGFVSFYQIEKFMHKKITESNPNRTISKSTTSSTLSTEIPYNSKINSTFSPNVNTTTDDPIIEDSSTTPTMLANLDIEVCPPVPIHRTENLTSILPDWKEVQDFCHSGPVELIIDGKANLSNIKMSCSENVHAIEIISALSDLQMKYFFTICSVTNITFLGSESCHVEITNELVSILQNVVSLSFQDMQNCAGNLFEKFVTQFYFPNLQILSFICVEFIISEFSIIDKIISSSNNFSQVYCSDQEMCPDLILHLNSSAITTTKVSCEDYLIKNGRNLYD